MKRLLVMILAGLGLWAVLLGPGWLLFGEVIFPQSAAALAITLISAVATMAWVNAVGRQAPEVQLLAFLGGTGIRMGLGLGLGAWLSFQYPDTFTLVFWGWVLIFYLFLLTLEVTSLVRAQGRLPGNESKSSS